MTIYEAIEHAREFAEGCPAEDRQCAYQHDKLADWLEELVILRAQQEAEKNEPLTVEELSAFKWDRTGRTKPMVVWIVPLKTDINKDDPEYGAPYFDYGEWFMFDGRDFIGMDCMDDLSHYGKHFVAYRRPPVGEAST